MGMAASQARYLALVARKSNCEFEGQQINQARTALSNQSANLFNQMLGLQVPVPPSTQDFTKIQYSFTDGINGSVMTDWHQLSTSDPDYNYVVTHYYETDRYTGSMKKLTDPQVQTTGGTGVANNKAITDALKAIEKAQAEYDKALDDVKIANNRYKEISEYSATNPYTDPVSATYNSTTNQYTVTDSTSPTPNTATYIKFDPATHTDVDTAIKNLIAKGALPDNFDINDVYVNSGNLAEFAFKKDLDAITGLGAISNTLPVYTGGTTSSVANAITTIGTAVSTAEGIAKGKNDALIQAKKDYEALNVPTHIGNSELTPLAELTKDQEVEIRQVIADMQEQGVKTNLEGCFDTNGNYIGGIFQFQMNGVTYFTTLDDLQESYASGTGNNNIDGQLKLTYYNASYVPTRIEKTERALIETDSEGRFASVRFEDDTVTYKLNMETITDEAAYDDAMNQYNYANAEYDKMIRDINAKTSIIQHQDQQLELRLKQLDTEQKALSTEMDAVKKVVDSNVESSFKTFGG